MALEKRKTRLLEFSDEIHVSGTRPAEWISAIILPAYKKEIRKIQITTEG